MSGSKRRTHCRRGHDLNVPENVYTAPDGERGCKVCIRAKAKDRYLKNKSKLAEYSRVWYAAGGGRKLAREKGWVKTGWTAELFYKTFEEQEGKCAVCFKKIGFKDEDCTIEKGTAACADHVHSVPPRPRGILCNNCNLAIGNLKDDPEIMLAAIAYVKKWKEG